MRRVVTPPSLAISRWTRSVAAFALLLLVAAFFLHRVLAMPTPVAMNLAKLAYGIAIVALLLGLAGGYAIWRTGAAGTGNITVGLVVGGAIMLTPPLVLTAASDMPRLNDVTTDMEAPPPFQSVSGLRPVGANPVDYPGGKFAARQQRYYPDIRPMFIERPSSETFALVVDAVRRENMKIVRQDPPPEKGSGAGFLEATDRTLVFGFYDDVSIRVSGSQDRSRVDLRSASRFGRHDLGANVTRVRTLMRQIVVRLEETVPAVEAAVARKKGDKKTKQDESRRREQAAARRSQARARARAQRARERRAQRRQKQHRVPNYISPIPGL